LRVFENRVLWRVFGPKRNEVKWEWRKLHSEELNDLYSLPNIVRVVKSRRMRWAGYVSLWGRREVCTRCWWGGQRERGHWGDPDVDGMDLQEVGGSCGDSMELAQDWDKWRALVSMIKNFRVS
jgi:hypothetical protein